MKETRTSLFHSLSTFPLPIARGGLALCILLAADAGWAQESANDSSETTSTTASPDEAERPKMNLSVPPSGPAVPRTDYVHRGFYARLSVGPGYMYSSLGSKGTSINSSSSANSFAVEADVLLGGSPSPGMMMGGGFLSQLGFNADYGSGGNTLFHWTAGPFFDAFPNDRDGFHMGTLLGLSGLSGLDNTSLMIGGGGAAWLGYDMWVAPEWSTGFNLQLGGSYNATSGASLGVFHTSLMITILHN